MVKLWFGFDKKTQGKIVLSEKADFRPRFHRERNFSQQ